MGREMKKNKIGCYFICGAVLLLLLGYFPYQKKENLELLLQIAQGGWFRLFLYLLLGYALTGALDGCERRWKNALRGSGMALSCLAVEKLFFLFVGGRVLTVAGTLWEATATLSGAGVAAVFSGGKGERSAGGEFSYQPLSTYRSELMGIALFLVLLVHMRNVRAYWGSLDYIFRRGYVGVDIFLLVSGLGMVFSLTRNWNLKEFYRKRAKTIFPPYLILVTLYTLAVIYLGRCGWSMLLLNWTTLDFYVGGRGAFNWYVSAIVLFYLFTPWIFRRMQKREKRFLQVLAMCMGIYLLGIVFHQFLGLSRLNIAFSRVPIYIVGMALGFAIQENVRFGWSQRMTMWLARPCLASCIV